MKITKITKWTQVPMIQLSRLIDLLTSCLVYSNCHNSALNYNIYWFNSSKVKKKCINRNYYDLYVLIVKIHGFPIQISRKEFRFGKNRVIYLYGSGYTFYRPWNQKTAFFNFLNIFRHLIIIYVFQVYKNAQ